MQLLPAIDILEGKVVRLAKGDYNAVTVYNDSPIDQAKALAEQYGQPFSIKEVLLTVKGETNFRKAKESFVPTKEGL